jgi:hypothetical protein
MAGEQSQTTFTFERDCSIESLVTGSGGEKNREASAGALALGADNWRQRTQGRPDERRRPYDFIG